MEHLHSFRKERDAEVFAANDGKQGRSCELPDRPIFWLGEMGTVLLLLEEGMYMARACRLWTGFLELRFLDTDETKGTRGRVWLEAWSCS